MDEIEYWLKCVRMLLPIFAISMVDRKVDELKFLHHQRREKLTDSFEKETSKCAESSFSGETRIKLLLFKCELFPVGKIDNDHCSHLSSLSGDYGEID